MAMGDSMTAGFAAMGRDTLDLFDEWRGLSGFVGGDKGATTVPNFFQHYNPSVIGASVGRHFLEWAGWDHQPEQDRLNAAQSNAGAVDLQSQLDYLLGQMAANPNIDVANDWKFLNLIIGANDVCGLCFSSSLPPISSVGDYYEKNLRNVIEMASLKVPRLFFNILPMFNVSQVYWISMNRSYCADFHDIFPFECICAFDSDQQKRTYIDSILVEFNRRIYKIVDEWKAKKSQTFAVQVQPFTANLVIPDTRYLSTLDCFHPSLLAHQKFAVSIWNSILTPWAKKKQFFDPSDPIVCPDANTRLYTD
jgi:phospholipase B1